jgi:hypothetical protein
LDGVTGNSINLFMKGELELFWTGIILCQRCKNIVMHQTDDLPQEMINCQK